MSTETQYCHPGGCSIERVDAKGSAGPYTRIYDSEGEVLFDFPGIWSDNEVMCALDFANQAYAKVFMSAK